MMLLIFLNITNNNNNNNNQSANNRLWNLTVNLQSKYLIQLLVVILEKKIDCILKVAMVL
jgi:hypothetical protein